MIEKIMSRKFIITLLIMVGSVAVPLLYKKAGISDLVVMTVLAIIGGVGVAYKAVNLAEHKADLKNASTDSDKP